MTPRSLKALQLMPTRASQFRRNAYYCQMLAADAASPADRACLLTMRRAWLALADTEDWLDGISSIVQSHAGHSQNLSPQRTERRQTWPAAHPLGNEAT